MSTVIYEGQCSSCGDNVKWVGTAGDPDVPKKHGDRVICLMCRIFGGPILNKPKGDPIADST